MNIGIVDYGMGNLLSVYNAFDYLGAEVQIVDNPEEIGSFEKLVLPGVGAYGDCIRNLESSGMKSALDEAVLNQKRPILGICLGMQVMSTQGEEGGMHQGLNWIPGQVIKLPKGKHKIPNIGWESVTYNKEEALFTNLPAHPDFYLVHSYYFQCDNPTNRLAYYSMAGEEITAAIRHENVYGTQFHPEKSSDFGRTILENFLDHI
jgi:glutamine amidotransferase